MEFKELGLSEELIHTVKEIGYENPTNVQEKAIPEILQGMDLIVQSKTGTGKTAAYALPIIQRIDREEKGIQALVVCPTRELAQQVEEEFTRYLTYIDDVKAVCIYGGEDFAKQAARIKGNVKIVVGTPGRILDHVKRKTLWLNKVNAVVLDEADEMLNMGFKIDIEKIFRSTSFARNTYMFSATLSDSVLEIAEKYTINPHILKLSADTKLTCENIKEYAVDVKVKMRFEAVSRFLKMYKDKTAIVFCNTKKHVDDLTLYLQDKGQRVDALHSDIDQKERTSIVKDFKEGKMQAIIATDLAARGLDIKDLDLVINLDIPFEDEYYVHRVGRTGRNGKAGMAITLYTAGEKYKLEILSKKIKSKMEYIKVPRLEDILNAKDEDAESITKVLKASPVDTSKMGKVYLNVGKANNVKAKDILGSIAANTAVPKQDIGHIWVEEEYTVVQLPRCYVLEVIQSMLLKDVKGAKVTVTREEV